jgi:hypothetical protein
MAEFFKILKADPLGDPYTPNAPGAKPTQSYWCQVEGQDKAVMIGKQVRSDGQPPLVPGQHVYGNLMYAKSQKGNEYWKFKSEKVPDDVQRPADSPAQAQAQAATTPANMSAAMPDWFKPVANQIDYIFREMRKMDVDAQTDIPLKTEPEAPAPVEHVGGEALDEETQARLDEIFTPDDVPFEEK